MNFDENGKLEKYCRRNRMFEPLQTSTGFGREGIEKLLPHRNSMLLLDEIMAIDVSQQQIEGKRYIHKNDPGFDGHFPQQAIYPGVLQIEMAGQLGLCLGAMVYKDQQNVGIRLWKVHKAVFYAQLEPDDEVTILASVLDDTGTTLTCAGQLLKKNEIVSFAIVEAVIVDSD